MEMVNHQTLNLKFWGHRPIKLKEYQEPKKLTDQDIMALRYAAGELLTSEYLPHTGILTREKIERDCSVCDEHLYLGNFVGYRLYENNNIVIRSLFFNEDSRLIAEVHLSDDEYEYYLIY